MMVEVGGIEPHSFHIAKRRRMVYLTVSITPYVTQDRISLADSR